MYGSPHDAVLRKDFEKPTLYDQFNVEWGTLNGVPPGWQERTVDEVKLRIQELSAVDLDALEKEYNSFEGAQTELRDDIVVELDSAGTRARDSRRRSKCSPI